MVPARCLIEGGLLFYSTYLYANGGFDANIVHTKINLHLRIRPEKTVTNRISPGRPSLRQLGFSVIWQFICH